MSACGTSETLKRRGLMSGSEPFSDSMARLCRRMTQSGLSGPCSLNSERRRCLGAGCASRAARETRRGDKQSSELSEWRIQLLRAMASVSRAKLVIRLFRPICLIVARRTLGADGKGYRANSVHGPLPQISTQAPPFNGCVVRRLPACDLPKRHYHERYLQSASCRRRSAQKLSRNDEPRRLCARSNAEL